MSAWWRVSLPGPTKRAGRETRRVTVEIYLGSGMTTQEAAARLGVTIGTVKKWLAAGHLVGVKDESRAWHLDEAEVERFRAE